MPALTLASARKLGRFARRNTVATGAAALATALMLASLFVAPRPAAAAPAQILVEGVLLSTGGAPAADGNYAITFSLYASATAKAALWTESLPAVAIAGGRFQQALGDKTTLQATALAGAKELWLGVQVGGDPELPRRRVLSTPYAMVSAVAESLSCSGCVSGSALANGGVAAAKVGFNYAGSTTKGGPALDLACTGCVSVSEIKFDGDVDLGGQSLKAKNATLTGDVVAKTVTAASFVGDGSKLTGLALPSGACKSGEAVTGVGQDGALVCTKISATPPPDGLDEVSNGLLSNQFTNVISATVKKVAIPDNTGADATSNVDVPDLGTAQALSVNIEVQNTDLSAVSVILLPPNDKKVGLVLCDPCAANDTNKTLKLSFGPTKPKSGDLAAWIGQNPKGIWNLKVSDTSFCVPQKPGNAALCDATGKTDGTIVDWSITIGTLSTKKVESKGMLVTTGGIQLGVSAQPPVTCDPAHLGFLYVDPVTPTLRLCNGKNWVAIRLDIFGTESNPAVSCKDLREKVPDSQTGTYWVDPDGPGGTSAFQVHCEMDVDGGGWTLVLADKHTTRWQADAALWYNTSDDGKIITPKSYGKSKAYATISGAELMVRTHAEVDGYWATFKMPTTSTTMLGLIGTTNIASRSNGYLATIKAGKVGAKAHACWKQDWRVVWRNYGSSDNTPDSSVFAPSGASSSARPCGGAGSYATGLGVRTDTSNGFSGYGGSFEGYGNDGAGNKNLTAGYMAIYVR